MAEEKQDKAAAMSKAGKVRNSIQIMRKRSARTVATFAGKIKERDDVKEKEIIEKLTPLELHYYKEIQDETPMEQQQLPGTEDEVPVEVDDSDLVKEEETHG